jgi:hypothetical protein
MMMIVNISFSISAKNKCLMEHKWMRSRYASKNKSNDTQQKTQNKKQNSKTKTNIKTNQDTAAISRCLVYFTLSVQVLRKSKLHRFDCSSSQSTNGVFFNNNVVT